MLHAITKYFYRILASLIFIISVVFFLKNYQFVSINYFFGSINVSLPLLLFITFIVGLLVGVAVYLPNNFRLQRKFTKLEKEHRLLSSKPDAPE